MLCGCGGDVRNAGRSCIASLRGSWYRSFLETVELFILLAAYFASDIARLILISDLLCFNTFQWWGHLLVLIPTLSLLSFLSFNFRWWTEHSSLLFIHIPNLLCAELVRKAGLNFLFNGVVRINSEWRRGVSDGFKIEGKLRFPQFGGSSGGVYRTAPSSCIYIGRAFHWKLWLHGWPLGYWWSGLLLAQGPSLFHKNLWICWGSVCVRSRAQSLGLWREDRSAQLGELMLSSWWRVMWKMGTFEILSIVLWTSDAYLTISILKLDLNIKV